MGRSECVTIKQHNLAQYELQTSQAPVFRRLAEKSSRRARSEPPSEGDFDDALSITSDFTTFSMNDIADPELLELSPFERCIEALYEKRYAVWRTVL